MRQIRCFALAIVLGVGTSLVGYTQDSTDEAQTPKVANPAAEPPPAQNLPAPDLQPIPLGPRDAVKFEALDPNTPSPRYVQSRDIIISWSEKMDVAWGFSTTTGRWTKQTLDPPAAEPPVVGSGLGFLRGGSTIYAYSGKTGGWDTLRLPKDHKPQVSVQAGFVLVTDGEDVYTFADATGRWTSPNGALVNETTEKPQTIEKAVERLVTVYPLNQARAESISKLLQRLFEQATINADERDNTLIVHGPQAAHEKIGALLKVLDAAPSEKLTRPATVAPEKANLGALFGGTTPADGSVVELRQRYKALESQAAELARQQRRHWELLRGAKDPDRQRLKEELTAVVEQAFQARQQLHRAELKVLQERLREMEQTLENRHRIQDQVIERRVEELLNPRLRWDDSPPSVLAPSAGNSAFDVKRPAALDTPEGRHWPLKPPGGQATLEAAKIAKQEYVEGTFKTQQQLLQSEILAAEQNWKRATEHLEYSQKLSERGFVSPQTLEADRIAVDKAKKELETARNKLMVLQQYTKPKMVNQLDAAIEKAAAAAQPVAAAQPTAAEEPAATIDFSKQLVHLRFLTREGAVLHRDGGDPLLVPGRSTVAPGKTYPFILSGVPMRPDLQVTASVEVLPIKPETVSYLQHNAIPIDITEEDLDQAASGNFVAKVVFLRHPELTEVAVQKVESITSTRLEPGLDPFAEAQRRGPVLAILRIGNRDDVDEKPHR